MVASLEEEIILVSNFLLNKKAVIVSNFCLIGKIPHDFSILTSIELARKTFIGIQVRFSVECGLFEMNENDGGRSVIPINIWSFNFIDVKGLSHQFGTKKFTFFEIADLSS